MGLKERPNLGHTGTNPDTGYMVDAEVLTSIMEPAHTLHQRGLYDPTRYSLKIPEVAAQFETIKGSGVGDQIMVRTNGMLPDGHPVYAYLKKAYGPSSKKPYLGEPQPNIEIGDGNTRQWLALLAIKELEEAGLPTVRVRRVPIHLIKNCTDDMLQQIFERTNGDRQGNGWFQNLLLFRVHRLDGLSEEEICARMRVPPRAITTFKAFDEVEDEVAKLYAKGGISIARVREIAKLPRKEQLAAAQERKLGKRAAREYGALTNVQSRKIADRIESHWTSSKANTAGYTGNEVAALLRYERGDRTALDKYPALLKLVSKALKVKGD
jgi:hypothetical protein